MDMSADEEILQIAHGVAEDITGDCLGNILDKLWTIGFDSGPLFLRVHAHVGDGFRAELVHTDTRLDVGKAPSGRETDKQHIRFPVELEVTDACWDVMLDGCFNRIIYSPPVFDDVRIGSTP